MARDRRTLTIDLILQSHLQTLSVRCELGLHILRKVDLVALRLICFKHFASLVQFDSRLLNACIIHGGLFRVLLTLVLHFGNLYRHRVLEYRVVRVVTVDDDWHAQLIPGLVTFNVLLRRQLSRCHTLRSSNHILVNLQVSQLLISVHSGLQALSTCGKFLIQFAQSTLLLFNHIVDIVLSFETAHWLLILVFLKANLGLPDNLWRLICVVYLVQVCLDVQTRLLLPLRDQPSIINA